MQTYVITLKNNGNWNDETQKEALKKCKELIEKQLKSEVKQYLSELLGDINIWINNQIEATIHTINYSNLKSA